VAGTWACSPFKAMGRDSSVTSSRLLSRQPHHAAVAVVLAAYVHWRAVLLLLDWRDTSGGCGAPGNSSVLEVGRWSACMQADARCSACAGLPVVAALHLQIATRVALCGAGEQQLLAWAPRIPTPPAASKLLPPPIILFFLSSLRISFHCPARNAGGDGAREGWRA